MSSGGEITAEIERFVHDHIDSVEKLEILFLLADEPQKQWSAVEVSQKLYRQPDSVATRLEELRDRGLLSVGGEATIVYRYAPGPQHYLLIQDLQRSYKIRKDAVIRLIFQKPTDSLRVFSDAFRIRRDS